MKKLLLGLSLLLSTIGVAAAADNTNTTVPVLATAASKAAAQFLAANHITVKAPALKMGQSNASSAAVFMSLNNRSNHAISLIAANSMTANQTLLQKLIDKGSKQVVRKVNKIVLEPQTDTVFEPGSFQVTLLGLKQTLHKGDSVPVLLIFDDGSSLTVRATVS
jgi:hypothetical protein